MMTYRPKSSHVGERGRLGGYWMFHRPLPYAYTRMCFVEPMARQEGKHVKHFSLSSFGGHVVELRGENRNTAPQLNRCQSQLRWCQL